MMCESAKCLELMKSNEAVKKKQQEAKDKANQTGEWYGLYRDEFGEVKITQAQNRNYPFFAYVSPDMRDA